MAGPIDMDTLADTLDGYGAAYLITHAEGEGFHTSVVDPLLAEGRFAIAGPSWRVRANAARSLQVSLIWPPPGADGHSLIVDGVARLDGDALSIAPSRAVLHRPAPRPVTGARDAGHTGDASDGAAAEAADGAACVSDCVEI